MEMVGHKHPTEQGGGFRRGTWSKRAACSARCIEVGKQAAARRCRKRHQINATGLRVAAFAQGTVAGRDCHVRKHHATDGRHAIGDGLVLVQGDSDERLRMMGWTLRAGRRQAGSYEAPAFRRSAPFDVLRAGLRAMVLPRNAGRQQAGSYKSSIGAWPFVGARLRAMGRLVVPVASRLAPARRFAKAGELANVIALL